MDRVYDIIILLSQYFHIIFELLSNVLKWWTVASIFKLFYISFIYVAFTIYSLEYDHIHTFYVIMSL